MVAGSVLILATLAGCVTHFFERSAGTARVDPHPRAAAVAARGAAGDGLSEAQASLPATHYASVERYKEALARHVVRTNADHTFSGPLPMMLPAVVVLRISVDRAGRLADVSVQRSRDDNASRVAMAAVRHSSIALPPHNLISRGERALTFSETFLFNKDYRFQVRSLALPQPWLGN